MTRKHGRPGITLTEVLVAMFVMALGLLALLTLFPLGAWQVAQALKDDRTSQTAMQADGYLRDYYRHNMVDPNSATRDPILPVAFDQPNTQFGTTTNDALYHPTYGLSSFQMAGVLTPLVAGQPSYPVLIDPLGYTARGSNDRERYWVAGRSRGWSSTPWSTFIPRRNLGTRTTVVQYLPLGFRGFDSGLAFQTCVLTDDMTFEPNGAPTTTLNRQGRYTWAALVQRPRAEDPSVATLRIMVFDGRPPGLAVPDDEALATGDQDGTAVNKQSGVSAPATDGFARAGDRAIRVHIPNRGGDEVNVIRRGGWVLDGTISGNIRNANFYRIAGVTEEGTGTSSIPGVGAYTQYLLDLETPLKPASDGTTVPYRPQFYFFAGLAEVFERPTLRPDRAAVR